MTLMIAVTTVGLSVFLLATWPAARRRSTLGPPPRCRHRRIAPVELSDGDRVAHLCLDCDEQLPFDFASPGDERPKRPLNGGYA